MSLDLDSNGATNERAIFTVSSNSVTLINVTIGNRVDQTTITDDIQLRINPPGTPYVYIITAGDASHTIQGYAVGNISTSDQQAFINAIGGSPNANGVLDLPGIAVKQNGSTSSTATISLSVIDDTALWANVSGTASTSFTLTAAPDKTVQGTSTGSTGGSPGSTGGSSGSTGTSTPTAGSYSLGVPNITLSSPSVSALFDKPLVLNASSNPAAIVDIRLPSAGAGRAVSSDTLNIYALPTNNQPAYAQVMMVVTSDHTLNYAIMGQYLNASQIQTAISTAQQFNIKGYDVESFTNQSGTFYSIYSAINIGSSPVANTSTGAITEFRVTLFKVIGNAGDTAITIGASEQTAPITTTTIGAGSPQAGSVSNLQVYRYFDKQTGGHFFTGDAGEAGSLLKNVYTAEANNFSSVNPSANDRNAVAVYRFFDTHEGGHFFTDNLSEYNTVLATRHDLINEGAKFLEHATQQVGDVAVYRFFDTVDGGHLFSSASSEIASLMSNSVYRNEGVAFYAPAA